MRVRSFNGAVGRELFGAILCLLLSGMGGCGGSHAFTNPPIVLNITVSQSPIVIAPGQTIYVPIMIMSPTETVSFAIDGLPAGISSSYKESESNPSGQLTLIANSSTPIGSYRCTITVGALGQTTSTVVPLNVVAASSH